MAAVLDRPDPLRAELAAPGEQLAESRLAGWGGQLAGELTAGRKDGAAGVGLLVGIRSDHNHLAVPEIGLLPSDGPPADEPHLGRCHAPIKSSRGSSGGGGRRNPWRSDLRVDTEP